MKTDELINQKNLIFLFYIACFAVLDSLYYLLSRNELFYSGIIGTLLIILYPAGAFCYGYKTGDRFRAPLAGIISYAFLIIFAFFGNNFQNLISSGHILLFTGYHLTLLILTGLIGFLSSGKEKKLLAIAAVLSVIWVIIFISGIS
ncbi:putative membrane protein YesL [Methanomicrobium sp. W14]|uniref:hypothetical protein n=1 Tax=Methanomicrobium sp. W14 TaxID=2817839 RepID=UPI001AE1C75E|nr:hypothetical protein [Methanomicrobium sp. W14]MBP2133657.1 putative membrane protein YesL [Methanomicrobium sp. W14]